MMLGPTYQSVEGLQKDDDEDEDIETFEDAMVDDLLWIFYHSQNLCDNKSRLRAVTTTMQSN